MLISLFSALFFILLVVRRLLIGPEAEGLFTLFALMFFLIGIALFGIGLLGEYVGRIYQQVRHRPRYLLEAVLEAAPEKPKTKRVKKVAAEEEAVISSLFSDVQE
jgi:undecaprenyl-phosphate 4-deoxy-4-formamido-L-arabinose transferase